MLRRNNVHWIGNSCGDSSHYLDYLFHETCIMKKSKMKNLRRQIAEERHQRIMTELMYEKALDELAVRTPLGFKPKKGSK